MATIKLETINEGWSSVEADLSLAMKNVMLFVFLNLVKVQFLVDDRLHRCHYPNSPWCISKWTEVKAAASIR